MMDMQQAQLYELDSVLLYVHLAKTHTSVSEGQGSEVHSQGSGLLCPEAHLMRVLQLE